MTIRACNPVETPGELDPVLELSLVVWSRKGSRLEDVPLGKQVYADDLTEPAELTLF